MEYKIIGNNLPAVEISLINGESIYTQSGGMAWMSDGINIETNIKGGLLGGLGRMFAGESLFMATYSCITSNAKVAFASSFPGKIIPITLEGHNLICQKDAFLCATPMVDLKVVFTKKFGAALFGGEGFILQKISGLGMAFLEIDGDICEYILAPGEIMKVDSGHIAAFEESVSYEIEMIKGFKNMLFGGEGLFLAKLRGPGKIYLQTMTIPGFAQRIIPFLPKPTSN